MTAAVIALATLALMLAGLVAAAFALWRADNQARRAAESLAKSSTAEAQKASDRERLALGRADIAEQRYAAAEAENVRLQNELRSKIKTAMDSGTDANRIAIGLSVFAQSDVNAADNDHGDEDRTSPLRGVTQRPAPVE